jgi:hypothetical protein
MTTVYLIWVTGGWGIDEDAPRVIKVFKNKNDADAYCKLHDGKHEAACGCHAYQYSVEPINLEEGGE